jgi:hypothetical protein
VAIGPLWEGLVDSGGHLSGTQEAEFRAGCDKLADNLVSVTPPAEFFPIRVKTQLVAGVRVIVGWADVSSVAVRDLTSYRRSRVPEN